MKPSDIYAREVERYRLEPRDTTKDFILASILGQMAEDIKELKRREELRNLQNNLRIFEEREWEK
jgi:hypothetical protein